MSEPPRPPGSGNPDDPTTPFHPPAGNEPPAGSAPPPPPSYGAPPPPAYGAPPPAYGAPPPPAYGGPPPPGQAQYGAPPPQYGAPHYGPPGPDDKTWILIAHFGGAVASVVTVGCGAWIAPLVSLLGKGNTSPVVRAEAVKALNFQLLWSVVAVIGWVTLCLAWLIVPIAVIISVVFGVIAGVRANNNQPYNYPLTYPLIK